MPKETVRISRNLEPFEQAAIFLETLAYPLSMAERTRFSAALCFQALQERSADPAWSDQYQLLRPAYVFQDPREVEKRMNKGRKIIAEQRLIAGKLCREKYRNHLDPQNYPNYHGPTSSEAVLAVSMDLENFRARTAKSHGSGGDKPNLIRLHWKPSKPVMHICIAMDFFLCTDPRFADHGGISFSDFFSADRELISDLVEAAEGVRTEFLSRLDIDDNETVQILMEP
jgi:hypothetical protein